MSPESTIGFADPALGEEVDEPCTGRRVAVPAVGPVAHVALVALIEVRHQRLLTEHVPAARLAPSVPFEPLLLLGAEHRALRIVELGARLHERGAAACLIGTILPAVEHVEVHEVAEVARRVHERPRAARQHPGGQRQVLVVGLVSRRAAREEDSAGSPSIG